MNLPLAWITGAGGLIGNYLVQTALRFPRVTCCKFLLAKLEFRRKIFT